MKQCKWIIPLLIIIFQSCTHVEYSGIKPINPEASSPDNPQQVDSLQPTFQWAPSSEHGVSYDFIIYDVIKIEKKIVVNQVQQRDVGKEIYYQEGITETTHRIRQPLKPDTEYFWSVRTRKGDKISAWATYAYEENYPGIFQRYRSARLFLIKTPNLK